MSPSTRTITFSQFATEFMNTHGVPINCFWMINWGNIMWQSEGVWFKDGEEWSDWGEFDSITANASSDGFPQPDEEDFNPFTFVTHAA